jgi:gliding motility-associated-like protein
MNQCTTTDTAIIIQPNPISIGAIQVVNNPCSAVNAGSAKVLQATGGTRPFTFIWNTTPQQVDSVASNLSAGNYSVTIIDANGCTYSQSATINTEPSVLAIAYTDTTKNLGENFILNSYNSIGTNASTTYQWYNSANSLIGNATTLNVSPTENEYFILRIFNDSICPSTDTVFIKIAKCGLVILPNAFSPNDDGLDDVYKIINPEDIESIIRFDIFDRWGKTMFSTNNKYEGWDGKVGGKSQPLETYVYYLHAKCYGGKEINLKGDITLIR